MKKLNVAAIKSWVLCWLTVLKPFQFFWIRPLSAIYLQNRVATGGEGTGQDRIGLDGVIWTLDRYRGIVAEGWERAVLADAENSALHCTFFWKMHKASFGFENVFQSRNLTPSYNIEAVIILTIFSTGDKTAARISCIWPMIYCSWN